MAPNFQGRELSHTRTHTAGCGKSGKGARSTEVNPVKEYVKIFPLGEKNETGHYTALSRRSRLRLRDGGGGDGGGGNVDEFKAGRRRATDELLVRKRFFFPALRWGNRM